MSNNAQILLNTPALLKMGIERLHRAAEKVGRRQMLTGGADDMLDDAAAFAAVGVRHLIVYAQRPTIEATLDVQQRFAEDVVRKSS